jgi:LuxR family maltose regulon positive regulatory protein
MAHPLTVRPRFSASKSVVPELPPEFVPRERLRRALDLAEAGQVVLLSAPAGYGKTVLLADWVRTGGDQQTAWVSLDSDDNDPRRFWSAVVNSLLALASSRASRGLSPEPAAGLARLAELTALPGMAGDVDVVEEVAGVLEALDQPMRLVLDDVHELTGRDALRGLARLVRRRPAGLQLVLASRADPPISVPRLRLEGRLHELRADALRFTLEDTASLMRAIGREVEPAQLAMLQARTEGWAAGLRLASLALGRSEDPAGFLISFSGDERSVAEYLTVEILDGLGPVTQDFLRAVSLCSPLPAGLAAELSGRPDADEVLDELAHETALVERTPSGSYRIHPLLRSHLVADLTRHGADAHRQLQAAAARWWSAAQDPVHALRHAERAGDQDLITALVHTWGVLLFLRGELGPLQRALAAVGAGARTRDPWLALTAAITHLDARALPAAAAEMHNARLAWPSDPSPGLDVLRASAELLASTQGLTGGSFTPALHGDERPAPELRALLHASRGIAAFSDAHGADLDLARTELDSALELARSHDLGYLQVQALYILAMLADRRSDPRGMSAAAEQAVSVAASRGRQPSSWSAGPTGMLAYADLLRGDPAAAAARCAEALATTDLLPPEATYTLHAVHGAALADLGQRAAGFAELRAGRAQYGDTPAVPSMSAALAVLEHRAALFNGNLGAAAEVAAWLAPRTGATGPTGETILLRAWTHHAAGRHEAARMVIAPVHRPETVSLLPHTLVEAHLIEAEAALHSGDQPTARTALTAALTAETIDVVRPFALAGSLTRQLLSTLTTQHGTTPFTARIAAAGTRITAEPAVLLSEREMTVLALLPTLLNAREIADEFTVSVNTVKSHIRAIYSKLGVSSRREAVHHAQDRGLLP